MIIKIIGAFIAIAGFAILIEIPKRYLACAGIIGSVGWTAYLIALSFGVSDLLANFISALVISVVSNIFARTFKAPVIVFLVAGILPTVPGAGMYRIAYNTILGDSVKATYYLVQTLEIAGVIAIAIFIVDAAFRVFQRDLWQKKRKKSCSNQKKHI